MAASILNLLQTIGSAVHHGSRYPLVKTLATLIATGSSMVFFLARQQLTHG